MNTEIWKDIKGYETYYEVSNIGRVRSVDRMETLSDGRKRLHKGRILKSSKSSCGYLRIVLSKSNEKKNALIHRIVAKAFIPNPDNLPEVNHKDEDKTNNCVFLKKDDSVDLDKSNLEWCDSKYNKNYGSRNIRIGEKNSKPVLQIDINTNEIIAEYPSTMEAERQLNISNSNISMCCNLKYKTAGGFKWQYKKE